MAIPEAENPYRAPAEKPDHIANGDNGGSLLRVISTVIGVFAAAFAAFVVTTFGAGLILTALFQNSLGFVVAIIPGIISAILITRSILEDTPSTTDGFLADSNDDEQPDSDSIT